MSVEVFLSKKNCFASATVLDVVGKDKCRCKLSISEEEITVDATALRKESGESDEDFNPTKGAVVEVRSDSEQEPGGDEPCLTPCWWVATVDSAKGEFYKVKYQGWDKRYDEIVELDRLRPHKPSTGAPLNVERYQIDVPDALQEWVHDPNNLREHIKEKCGAWGLALAHAKGAKGKGKHLRLILLGEKTAQAKAEMLLKLHAKHQVGLKGLKQQAAGLEQTLESERQKRGNSIVEEFTISSDLIGMVVGKGGSNIRKAETESGVHSAMIEGNKVVIHGPNRASVDQCRSMLEMMKAEVDVEQDQLGWIIGKKGANIRELMDETGVSRAEVMKGVSPPKMQLIGTASAVEQAKLWLQCHTDYLNEMAEQEDEIGQLNRELDKTTFGPGRKGGGKGGRGGGYLGGKGGGRGPREPAPEPLPESPKPRARKEKAPQPEAVPAPKEKEPKTKPAKKETNGGEGPPKPNPKPKAAPKPKEAKDAPPNPKPKAAKAEGAPVPKPKQNAKPKPKSETNAKPKPAAEGAGDLPPPKPQRKKKEKADAN